MSRRVDSDAALDADTPTLHIRCGSDIRDRLREAGFAGDFLECSDPLCDGPVRRGVAMLEERAAFIATRYGLDRAAETARLRAERDGLAAASRRRGRIVLWFEHDSYDQLLLGRILAAFAAAPPAAVLELICIDRHPAVERFIGLGQLSSSALRDLWPHRRRVGLAQLRLGTAAWEALCEATPLALHALAASGTPMLPEMAPALRRHLQELPWRGDGLSLTQRLVLQALSPGPRTVSQLFNELQTRTEPLPFLGDLMLWGLLRDMLAARDPPFAIDPQTRASPWPRQRLSLTAGGHALVAGGIDWHDLGPSERWVGGVCIAAPRPAWRWDPEADRPVPG